MEFVRYYNDTDLTIREITRKMNISLTRYRCLRNAAVDKGLLVLRKRGRQPKVTRKTTYIHRRDYGRYFVIKKGKTYYACVKSYSDAEKIVERLKACDWDKSQASKIKMEVLK